MTKTHVDTTEYSWDKSEFVEFEVWLRSLEFDSNYPIQFKIIDWVIETDRNRAKEFFGFSLGKDPYQNPVVFSSASDFADQYYAWFKHKEKSHFAGIMSWNSSCANYEAGYSHGYWQQPKKTDNPNYLEGYQNGWNSRVISRG